MAESLVPAFFKNKMSKATDIIKRVAEHTDKVLLFHSATGKDSIVMLDLVAPYFKEVVCVYMYMVPNLRSVNRYIKWSEARYPNCRFIQAPHFNISGYVKIGYLGMAQNPKQPILNLASITEKARAHTGIDWALFGMKEVDSLNRRVMLRTYDNGICWKTRKAYPLMEYKNKDVVRYIKDRGLIPNMTYGNGRASSGENVGSALWLAWLRENYPDDLAKVVAMYPMTEQILFEYDKDMERSLQLEQEEQ